MKKKFEGDNLIIEINCYILENVIALKELYLPKMIEKVSAII